MPSSWSYTHSLVTSSNVLPSFQVNDMFMWLVQPCLEFIRLQCKFVVQTSPTHLAFSLMKLYSSLLGKHYPPFLSQLGVGCCSSCEWQWDRRFGLEQASLWSADRARWKESMCFGFSLDLGLISWVFLCLIPYPHNGSWNSCPPLPSNDILEGDGFRWCMWMYLREKSLENIRSEVKKTYKNLNSQNT